MKPSCLHSPAILLPRPRVFAAACAAPATTDCPAQPEQQATSRPGFYGGGEAGLVYGMQVGNSDDVPRQDALPELLLCCPQNVSESTCILSTEWYTAVSWPLPSLSITAQLPGESYAIWKFRGPLFEGAGVRDRSGGVQAAGERLHGVCGKLGLQGAEKGVRKHGGGGRV